MLTQEKEKRILKDLEGCTLLDWRRLEIAFMGKLVYLQNCEPQCVGAALKATKGEGKKENADK